MMRIGLIGAGRWGKRYIETIARMDGVELAHLGSTNPASTQLVPSGCRVSSDWHDVACDRTLQGIILASPPVMHCEMALASINARIPILIEKPMTLSARDARAVVSSSGPASVVMNFLTDPERPAKLGRADRERVLKDCSVEAMMGRLRDTHELLLTPFHPRLAPTIS